MIRTDPEYFAKVEKRIAKERAEHEARKLRRVKKRPSAVILQFKRPEVKS
ncbi:hypothetical protein [Phyllobacterium lublinensis]|nr:hypothetical protein [Phyllobacterium sp. 2063]MBZ9654679.1 hypothetical protein [Phyllobacterium sp. 2063]